jgi:mono/diheme cytochrome c family protein
MTRAQIAASASTILASLTTALPTRATPQPFTQAKGAGLLVKNCQHCHVATMPKKEGFKPEDRNNRSKWLLGEKDKQKATEIKAEWLTIYPGAK